MTGAGGWTCLRGGQIYYMSGSFRLNHMFAASRIISTMTSLCIKLGTKQLTSHFCKSSKCVQIC